MNLSVWARDSTALSLLETLGGPFSTRAFRNSVVEALPGWRDVSLGARSTSDGTLVAVPCLARARAGESVPPDGYGGLVSTRPLEPTEAQSFLEFASRVLSLPRLVVRSLELDGTVAIGTPFATASVVPVGRAAPVDAGYARLTRRSLRRAAAAGATVTTSDSFDAFWAIYAAASSRYGTRYPGPLVRQLVESAAATVHTVRVGDRPVASLLTLVSPAHWMCWLAGQTQEGREIAASYLAYDAVLNDARDAGVGAVNLGASVGGGAEFKRRLGAHEIVMREWKHETAAAAAGHLARRGVAGLRRRLRGTS